MTGYLFSELPKNMQSKISIGPSKDSLVPGPCWTWIGCLNSRNYGCVSAGHGTIKLAHRIAYETYKGEIPDGYQVDHLCFNTKCCNPEHLDAVTPKVNAERSRKATKTHCVHGHPLAGENLRMKRTANGLFQRQCRVCGIDHRRRVAERESRGLRTPNGKWELERESRRAQLIASGEAALERRVSA
jgi:hypothetical protein